MWLLLRSSSDIFQIHFLFTCCCCVVYVYCFFRNHSNWIVRLTHVYLNFWGNFTDKINVNENKRDVSQTISEMCCCCHLPTDMHNIPLNFFGANGGGGSNSGGGNDSHNVLNSTIWMQNIRKKICNDHNNARTKKLHAHTFMSRLRLRYGIHLKMLSLNLNISKVKTMALAHMHGVRKRVRNNGFKWLCEQRLMQSHICNIYSKLVEGELILFSVIWIERKISSNALPIACGCCCRSFVCFGFMLLLLHLY